MNMIETASAFFEACETGKGWDGCRAFSNHDASFSCQADALADTVTPAAYADWMKGLLGPIPDGRYELKAFAADETRNMVVAAAVFHGSNTEQGPVPATGKTVASDYVYAIRMDAGKVRHMTKVWNDSYALRALGWA